MQQPVVDFTREVEACDPFVFHIYISFLLCWFNQRGLAEVIDW